jgi:hypothetical protein
MMMCSQVSVLVLVLVLCDKKPSQDFARTRKNRDAARHATRDLADAGRFTSAVSINNMHTLRVPILHRTDMETQVV